MTSLDLAHLLKAEIQKEHEVISKHMRRRNILEHFASRLRLGVSEKVVRSEIEAQGETIDVQEDD